MKAVPIQYSTVFIDFEEPGGLRDPFLSSLSTINEIDESDSFLEATIVSVMFALMPNYSLDDFATTHAIEPSYTPISFNTGDMRDFSSNLYLDYRKNLIFMIPDLPESRLDEHDHSLIEHYHLVSAQLITSARLLHFYNAEIFNLKYLGPWQLNIDYVEDDVTQYNGTKYKALQDNLNVIPSLIVNPNWVETNYYFNKGFWRSSESYLKDSIVRYEKDIYISLVDNINLAPDANIEWDILPQLGDWSSSTIYVVNDVVHHEGAYYVALQNNSNLPVIDNDYWYLIYADFSYYMNRMVDADYGFFENLHNVHLINNSSDQFRLDLNVGRTESWIGPTTTQDIYIDSFGNYRLAIDYNQGLTALAFSVTITDVVITG